MPAQSYPVSQHTTASRAFSNIYKYVHSHSLVQLQCSVTTHTAAAPAAETAAAAAAVAARRGADASSHDPVVETTRQKPSDHLQTLGQQQKLQPAAAVRAPLRRLLQNVPPPTSCPAFDAEPKVSGPVILARTLQTRPPFREHRF
jgi:hypothetical protein